MLVDKKTKTKVENELLEVLDSLPFYVMLIDSDHYILMANKAVRRHLGVKPEQIIGGFCPEVIHGLKQPYPGCPVEEAVQKGHAVEREFLDSDTKRWVKSAAYPIGLQSQEGKMVFFHMISDITERKISEEKLQEKIGELETWQRLTVGREMKMIDLKRENEELKEKLKKYVPS